MEERLEAQLKTLWPPQNGFNAAGSSDSGCPTDPQSSPDTILSLIAQKLSVAYVTFEIWASEFKIKMHHYDASPISTALDLGHR